MRNLYDFVKALPEERKQFSFKNLLFVQMDCPRSLKFDVWNQHNCLIHVLSGRKYLYSREQSWPLQKGTTLFLKKGAITIEKIGEEPLCVLMFFVPDEYLRSFIRENTALIPKFEPLVVSNDKVLHVQNTSVMQSFYESVICYFETAQSPVESLLELKFKELLLNIITNQENVLLIKYLWKVGQTNFDDLKEIMESNCLYNLRLIEYSRLCNRSLSKFKRDFFAAFGETPARWLLLKRLNQASHLLIHTEKLIGEISLECGFVNNTHFVRVFKENFGTSPLKYRKQLPRVAASNDSNSLDVLENILD